MVNTLSGSVCAYRKETVKPRFIRIDEVMALLDVTQDEAMDIALAAGARYQLAKIILVHKERLMKFMKHSARVPSSNKIVEKKFVRIGEGSMTYSIGHHRFIEMARAAGAVYKIGEAKGNTILINLEVFDEYMEQFREPPTEMKHPLPNVKNSSYGRSDYSDERWEGCIGWRITIVISRLKECLWMLPGKRIKTEIVYCLS